VRAPGAGGRWLAVASAAAVVALSLPAHGDSGTGTHTRSFGLSARPSAGKSVKVSGWATFSGAVIGSKTDSATDGKATADASGAELIGADLVYRPELADFFIRFKVTAIPTAGPIVGDPTVLYGLKTVIGGHPVEVRAQSTGIGAQFGLFDCGSESGCKNKATLVGGFGTTGEEVVVDLPLATISAALKLHLREGDWIGTPIAYTARGAFDTQGQADQQQQRLDDVVLNSHANVRVPVKSVTVSAGSVTRHATLKDGHFTATLPRSAFSGNPATVRLRTCLGSCVTQKMTVRL
jgi:hypothetical protein